MDIRRIAPVAAALTAVTVVLTGPIVSTTANAATPRDGVLPCQVVLVVDDAGAQPGFTAAVGQVAGELTELTGVQVSVTTQAPSPAPEVAVVAMAWGPHPQQRFEGREAFGIASVPSAPGPRMEASVLFTPLARDLGPNGLTNLVRHELGHVFGLPHATIPVSTMAEDLHTLNIVTARGDDPWTADVRAALTGLYGGFCTAQ